MTLLSRISGMFDSFHTIQLEEKDRYGAGGEYEVELLIRHNQWPYIRNPLAPHPAKPGVFLESDFLVYANGGLFAVEVKRLGAALAVAVIGPGLVRRQSRRSRAAIKDLTERAGRWEERACAQEQAHARFMRELDHELKNPLQAIKTAFADLEETAGLSESVQTARGQVERLRTLSGRLRQVASVTPERLVREPVDLDEVVKETVDLARAAVPGSAERVRLVAQQIPWRPAPVLADRELLSHAIYNLLDNALKYSPVDRPVEVRLREDGATATIEVADAGTGIDPADLPHVTEELYRGDRTHGVEGSGLGLALVNRVAVAHGGRLDLRAAPTKAPWRRCACRSREGEPLA
jgi:two-component system, OmpR family, sensor kinase